MDTQCHWVSFYFWSFFQWGQPQCNNLLVPMCPEVFSLIEWFGLEGTFKGHLVQPPAMSRYSIQAAPSSSPCPSVLLFRAYFTNKNNQSHLEESEFSGSDLTHPQAPSEVDGWGLLSWNLLGTLWLDVCQRLVAGCEQGQVFLQAR